MKVKPAVKSAKKPVVKKQRVSKKQQPEKEITLIDPWEAASELDELSYKLSQIKGLANVVASQESAFTSTDEKEVLWLLHDLIEKVKGDVDALDQRYRQLHFDNNSLRFGDDAAWPEDLDIAF